MLLQFVRVQRIPFIDHETTRDCRFPQRAGKEFFRLGGRDSASVFERREQYCERLTGRLSWRVIVCAMTEPKRRSAVVRVCRNGALEKTGADIQAERSQTERCAQNKRTKQSDGHERIKARLGFGNDAYRDIRSGVHGNLHWKNNQSIIGRQKLLCRRHNFNFDCGE